MKERRSIRKYLEKQIPVRLFERIVKLDCTRLMRAADSAAGFQAVRNPVLSEKPR